MPIIDYELKAKQSEEYFFNNPNISEKNKDYIKKFLDQYDVSPARKNIFFKHIYFLLSNVKDIKKEMSNKELINRTFKILRDRLSTAYYSTIVNVSLRFVRWLNDGNKPEGFKDIKNLSRNKQKRDLKPNDMISWEDGLTLVNQTTSLQIKAILLTQLDGGFRPSEFIDLDYGDISVKKDFIIARVNHGKTGSRDVILFKSVPYLMRWLEQHPTKKKGDPLWIMEFIQKSNEKDKLKKQYEIRRYEYSALAKRIKQLGWKIKFEKPLDFYNLRHSACVLSKKDNVNPELAADKFGHTIEFYTRTYGRLSTDDNVGRFSKHYGIEEEKQKIELNKTCKCGFVNPPQAEICDRCGSPLTINKALELDRGKDKEIMGLRKEMNKTNEIMAKLIKGLAQKGKVSDILNVIREEGLIKELGKLQ